MAESKLKLKLLIDRKARKVLFAEASKDFVDFLFSLLSLPLGTITSRLSKDNMVGCLGTLSQSIENLDESYIAVDQRKDWILKPDLPMSSKAIPPFSPEGTGCSRQTKLYSCTNNHRCVTDVPYTSCSKCRCQMCYPVDFLSPQQMQGGYVKGLVKYMVMDDLSVAPISFTQGMDALNMCNVRDLNAVEQREVGFGIEEAVALLKASLQSKTALTHVFISKKPNQDSAPNSLAFVRIC